MTSGHSALAHQRRQVVLGAGLDHQRPEPAEVGLHREGVEQVGGGQRLLVVHLRERGRLGAVVPAHRAHDVRKVLVAHRVGDELVPSMASRAVGSLRARRSQHLVRVERHRREHPQVEASERVDGQRALRLGAGVDEQRPAVPPRDPDQQVEHAALLAVRHAVREHPVEAVRVGLAGQRGVPPLAQGARRPHQVVARVDLGGREGRVPGEDARRRPSSRDEGYRARTRRSTSVEVGAGRAPQLVHGLGRTGDHLDLPGSAEDVGLVEALERPARRRAALARGSATRTSRCRTGARPPTTAGRSTAGRSSCRATA